MVKAKDKVIAISIGIFFGILGICIFIMMYLYNTGDVNDKSLRVLTKNAYWSMVVIVSLYFF